MSPSERKTALLLIDIQEGFKSSYWGPQYNLERMGNVASLLNAFREMGLPIHHVQHLSANPESPLYPGQSGNEFMSEAKPLPGEPVHQKRVHSAFIGTELESALRKEGIESLVIGGISVDHCVSTSTRMAYDLGFEVILVSDATAAYDRKGVDGTLYPAALVHAITLASLEGEFATVLKTQTVLDEIRQN